MASGEQKRRGAACGIGVAAAVLLMLGGCRPSVDRANAYEALYDQQMPLKAYPAALTSINSALKQDENEPRRWVKLGQVLLALDRPAQAADALRHALDLQPDNLTALETLAVLSVRGNQFDMAKRYIDPLLLMQPTSLGGLFAASLLALHEKRYADADKAADLLIATYPDREEGRVLKSRVLDASGQSRAAAAFLEKRAADHPASAEINQQLMALYQKLGDVRGVQETALRLAAIFPDDPRYALESARAWHARGRDDRADAVIARVVARFGGNPPAIGAVGRYWQDTLPPATAHDRIARLAATAAPGARAVLGSMLVDMGDPAGGIRILAPLAPDTVTSANIDAQGRYARALLAAGRSGAAEAKVRAILGFDPANPDGLLVRARLELARKDYSAALTDAQLVASDDGQNEEAALLAATIYAAQGNQILAGAGFASARNAFPHSIAALRAETQWLMAQHRTGDALDRAVSFIDSHPRRSDGWALYASLCAAAGDVRCQAKARRALGTTA